jgi:hypothetical protein
MTLLSRNNRSAPVSDLVGVKARCHVTAHSRNGLLHLGWSHFWLLIAILGGMLALVGMVFVADLVSR